MPEIAANCNDPSDLDRVEEELDVQYQAAIQSLLNRVTELGGEAAEACAAGGSDTVSPAPRAESVSEASENTQSPADPREVEAEDTSPMRSMPTPRSHPSETTDQLRDLRRIAKASAHTAITTHAARRRKQIMLPVYVAIPLGVCALILSQWIFEGGGAVALVVVGISIAVTVVTVRGFVALRQLDAALSSTEEPGETATDASAFEKAEPIREDT